MNDCKVALFGCGTVGTGVARMLLGESGVQDRMGRRIKLKYIVDARTEEVGADIGSSADLIITEHWQKALSDAEIAVVIELFGGTTAAREVTERALRAGKHVVTANKALLAEAGDDLFRLARSVGRSIAYEAAVAGGIPVVAAIRDSLVGDRIQSVYGILNGTCNYILTRMLRTGIDYAQALAEAQRAGYAEADPTLDVEGADSAHKLAVLARLAFGCNVSMADIYCEGISGIELSDLRYAQSMGYTTKLLAVGVRRGDKVELRVHPALLHMHHPLASVDGVYNAVCVHGSHVGEIVLTGRGAGREPTAAAVVADIARLALGTYQASFAALGQFGQVVAADAVPIEQIATRYYFRLDCADRPGVLAQVAGILGEEDISIASVRQQEACPSDQATVPVVFMTHQAPNGAMRRALDRINRLGTVRAGSTRMIRVEDIRGDLGEPG